MKKIFLVGYFGFSGPDLEYIFKPIAAIRAENEDDAKKRIEANIHQIEELKEQMLELNENEFDSGDEALELKEILEIR